MPLLMLILALAAGAVQRPSEVVQWRVEAPAAAVAKNGVARLTVTATIARGWKLYAIEQPEGGPEPLAFETPDAHFSVNEKQIVAPKPKIQKDDNFGVETRYYDTVAAFTVPVSVSRTAAEGRRQVPLEVTFQACGAELCLRPFTQTLNVEIDVKR